MMVFVQITVNVQRPGGVLEKLIANLENKHILLQHMQSTADRAHRHPFDVHDALDLHITSAIIQMDCSILV